MKSKVFCCLCLFSLALGTAEGAIKIRDGKIVDADAVATMPVQDHFQRGLKAIEAEDWDEAALNFRVVTTCFQQTQYGAEGWYYLGVAEYHTDELDAANEALSKYLKAKNNPKFFQDAIEYKFAIAEKLRSGVKRRFFGTKKLPKWASGESLAIQIYDEIIAALPCHDLTARALFSKGVMCWSAKNYKTSVDSLHMLIKRFPKHELSPESYVVISRIFLEQSRTEFQNPDVLAFAEINLRKFKHDFPKEERIPDVEKDVADIKEIYANGLFETGLFYERIKKPMASAIYYQNAIKLFPETAVAQKCLERLQTLKVCDSLKSAKPG